MTVRLAYSHTVSLPPSKIKDFCHLPRQREAWALRKIADRTVHRKLYRSAHLYLFDKLEVDEPTDYYFSLTLSSRISGRA